MKKRFALHIALTLTAFAIFANIVNDLLDEAAYVCSNLTKK